MRRNIIKEVLDFETKVVSEMRADGQKAIRPSTLLFWLISTLYVLSGLDFIPEIFVTPRIFGMFDDFALVVVCVVYTIDEIPFGGFSENKSKRLSGSGDTREAKTDIKRSGSEESVPFDDSSTTSTSSDSSNDGVEISAGPISDFDNLFLSSSPSNEYDFEQPFENSVYDKSTETTSGIPKGVFNIFGDEEGISIVRKESAGYTATIRNPAASDKETS